MRNFKKYFIPLFLSFALLFSACGGKAEDDISEDSTPSGITQQTPASSSQPETGENNEGEGNYSSMPGVKAIIGDKEFTITLAQTDAALNFKDALPMTLDMKELNGNEKYCYTGYSYRSAPEKVGYINEGDLMLYGDDCIVLFYRSFSTFYSYTPLGKTDDIDGLAIAVGSGDVTVTFEIIE